ncbi:UNVERIFIED_CONTAM: hypothetical protein FKN15_048149, partial [Acipenser sinensis]
SEAVFTFGKSKFADNVPSKFWLKNDRAVRISCGDEHTALVTVHLYPLQHVILYNVISTDNGKLYMFGSNNWGQLCLGTKNTVNKPTCVKGLFCLSPDSNIEPRLLWERVEKLVPRPGSGSSSGSSNSGSQPGSQSGSGERFRVRSDGELYTFGESDHGKLGLPPEQLNNNRVPQLVQGISAQVTRVVCGGGHTVALTDDDVYTFGLGQFGQLGHGTFTFETALPKAVEHFRKRKVSHIACGENHTAVITGVSNARVVMLALWRQLPSSSVLCNYRTETQTTGSGFKTRFSISLFKRRSIPEDKKPEKKGEVKPVSTLQEDKPKDNRNGSSRNLENKDLNQKNAGENTTEPTQSVQDSTEKTICKLLLQISHTSYTMVLIDKHGMDKERYAFPVTAAELFTLIDTFPLRKEEMKVQAEAGQTCN